MTTNIPTRLANSAIGRKLRAQENFPAVDKAVGRFIPCNRRDDARLSRTSGWLIENCKAMWRRTVNQPGGYVAFEFEAQEDADAFRAVTASDPGMIPCI